MADYREALVAGTKWQRACRVVVENPYSQTPSINFVEEEAINTGDKIITNLCSNLIETFTPSKEVPILDLVTGEPTGLTFNHMELYQMINSLYMQLANVRDTPIVVDPPVEPPVDPPIEP